MMNSYVGIGSSSGSAEPDDAHAGERRREVLADGDLALAGSNALLVGMIPSQAGRRMAGVLIASALLAASLTMPATAAEDGGTDGGTVTATVTVTPAPEVCVSISLDAITFVLESDGTTPMLDFGQRGVNTNYVVLNCGTVAQDFYVSATNPSSVEGSTWTLAGEPGVNQISVQNLDNTSNYASLTPYLTNALGLVNTFNPGGPSYSPYHGLAMPTSGGGAGEALTFTIDWVAALSG